jgi:hypothetical protein
MWWNPHALRMTYEGGIPRLPRFGEDWCRSILTVERSRAGKRPFLCTNSSPHVHPRRLCDTPGPTCGPKGERHSLTGAPKSQGKRALRRESVARSEGATTTAPLTMGMMTLLRRGMHVATL